MMANGSFTNDKNLWENPYFRVPFISACLLGATCAIALISIFGISHLPLIGFATLITAGTAGLIALLGVRIQRLANKMDQGIEQIQQVTENTAQVVSKFDRLLTEIQERELPGKFEFMADHITVIATEIQDRELPEKFEFVADKINMIADEIQERELHEKFEAVANKLHEIATEVKDRQIVEKIHTTSTAISDTVANSTLLSSVSSIGATFSNVTRTAFAWLPLFGRATQAIEDDEPASPNRHARSQSSPN